jgi:thymidine kinase
MEWLLKLTVVIKTWNQIKIGAFIMNKTGNIELILGPMFSGKSSEMQRKVRRYQHARKECLVINYVRDNRYSFEDVAATHDK